MTESVTERIALVTGAGRGIGRACAIGLAAGGIHVIAVSRTGSDLRDLETLGAGKIETWQADVTSDEFIERLSEVPRLDILINNAGTNKPMSVGDVDVATLDHILNLNVRAVYRVSQAAIRIMLRSNRPGSIVHMSSQMGHVGAPKRSVYCMTKHAVEGLTKALAVELGPQGIRVNAVAPTFIDTDLTRAGLKDHRFQEEVLASIPLGRLGSPQDVVAAVLFLVSDEAQMVTGISLKVDGGWTAR